MASPMYRIVKGGVGNKIIEAQTALQQNIERLTRLPKAQQKLVLQMLDGVFAQASR
jgi:hypothetical protein